MLNAVSEAPVAGAQVDYEEDGRVQTTRTDSKGYFEFGAGTLGIVTVRAEGFGTAYMRWPPTYGASLRIVLREPRSASGTVIDMVTRNPIGGATVTVMALSVNRNIIFGHRHVEARGGEFGFEDLPAGRDQVEVHRLRARVRAAVRPLHAERERGRPTSGSACSSTPWRPARSSTPPAISSKARW